MPFKLTKDQLKKSAFYSASGVDFQPLIRFSDSITDFIYVSLDLTKEEFLEGVHCFLEKINVELTNSNLSLIKVNEINLSEIEHVGDDRFFLTCPDFFTESQFLEYNKIVEHFNNPNEDFSLELIFNLTLNAIEREIRLFHFNREALATYSSFFIRQNIAPIVFISIQSGQIEKPSLFSDVMFEKSIEKPKVWIRGYWKTLLFNVSSVFPTDCLYNIKIGEFANWTVGYGFHKELITDYEKPNRFVRAFAVKGSFDFVKSHSIEGNGILINKIRKLFDASYKSNYNLVLRSFQQTNLHEIQHLAIDFFEKKNDLEVFKIAIIPSGYEMYEGALDPFIESFNAIPNKKVEIDIFYKYPLDLNRFF
jgi:hypothetical protein